jgi:CHAD domain-containing protein
MDHHTNHVTLTHGLRTDLRADLRTDVATKAILRRLFATLLQHEAGVKKHSDIEDLHHYRVALRKTRALLKQATGVFPQRPLQQFRGQFRWLGACSGPARDVDVYLENLAAYHTLLPQALVEHLAPLQEQLLRMRDQHYRLLDATLAGSRYRRLLTAYRKFLEQPVPAAARLPDAGRPLQEVADEHVWRSYRRLMRRGAAITAASPVLKLHELRKQGKQLRYLLETYQSLYDREAIQYLLEKLKALQDNLGRLHDLYVQREMLREQRATLKQERRLPPQTARAMQHLLRQLDQLEAKERTRFDKRFRAFCTRRNQSLYRRLFREGAA